jgi:hypothetical protein
MLQFESGSLRGRVVLDRNGSLGYHLGSLGVLLRYLDLRLALSAVV